MSYAKKTSWLSRKEKCRSWFIFFHGLTFLQLGVYRLCVLNCTDGAARMRLAVRKIMTFSSSVKYFTSWWHQRKSLNHFQLLIHCEEGQLGCPECLQPVKLLPFLMWQT